MSFLQSFWSLEMSKFVFLQSNFICSSLKNVCESYRVSRHTSQCVCGRVCKNEAWVDCGRLWDHLNWCQHQNTNVWFKARSLTPLLFWSIFWILLESGHTFWSSVNLQPGLIAYAGLTSWGSEKCCGNIWTVPHVEQNKEPKPRDDKCDSFCVLSPVIGLHVPPLIITIRSFTMICFSSKYFYWFQQILSADLETDHLWAGGVSEHKTSILLGLNFQTSCHDYHAGWR